MSVYISQKAGTHHAKHGDDQGPTSESDIGSFHDVFKDDQNEGKIELKEVKLML
jgi:hypothetical protein